MKYSEKNPPHVCLQTNSSCYKNTYKTKIYGILWHSTGCNNTNISRWVQPLETDADYNEQIALLGNNPNNNDWNHVEVKAGVNAWVGKLADGTIATVQSMPWEYAPWGVGRGDRGTLNYTHTQFEICEDDLTSKEYFEAAYKEACELTAYLCQLYNIDPLGKTTCKHSYTDTNGKKQYKYFDVPNILCHKDAADLGVGYPHADVIHWFSKYGKTMQNVREDVAALLREEEEDDNVTQEKFNEMMNVYLEELANKPASWEKAAMDWAVENGLMQGDSQNNLMPKKFMTRGELATVLQRFGKNIENE